MRREDLSPAETPVLLIPIEVIDVPKDRLRSLKEPQATAIGAAIVADRQYDPITVAKLPGQTGFVLVDGLHRLEGCRMHGVASIEARIVDGNREARVRQEVLSGVARATHDVFDRAAQVAALAAIAREKAGKPPMGDLRKLNGRLSNQEIENEAVIDLELSSKSLHWSETTADAFDIGPRQVRKYAVVAERFTPEMIAVLREREMADQLGPIMALANLPPFDLERAIGFIADFSAATIAEALNKVTGAAEPTPFNKKLNKFVSWAEALSVRERRQLMAELTARYDLNGMPLKSAAAAKAVKP